MPPVVLVVDDDAVSRSVVAGVLRQAGLRTVEADSGFAALEVLAEWAVDAALVDHSMPGMSGLELTKRIRQLPDFQLTPILFLSSADSPSTRLAALKAGATDFMVKPLPFEEVVARLEAQMQLSARWGSTVKGLQQRAATVAGLAGLGAEGNPTVVSRLICERISRAHGGAGVCIFSWAERSGEPSLLAVSGRRPEVLREAGAVLGLRGEAGPWIEYPSQWGGGSSSPGWVVCAPLRRRQVTVGVLAIEGQGASQEEMMAAGMDYAPTVALLLGAALTESRRTRESREMVERTLATGAFQPLFQPIVQISSGDVLGYEALTRLTSGDPIIQLLTEANEAGIRAQCEVDLLAAALRDARELPDAWVSVNLSPSVVVERTEELATLISTSRCEVVVELTENERIEDYVSVRDALARLGDQVRLSVDDTGSGYASLRHVIDLHPHFLKLDRSWISGLDRDQTRQALVAGMVAFCRHTDTEMIAEGVETESELATLRELDVRLAQGYLLGRPEPANQTGGRSRARS
ncbi:MAG TPA: EAL domain-containing response regulator [Acidimicrobiales bacterium]|nr:EAL domain-containing response regulator [Acidimicrobiales bacterium]